MTEEQKIEFEQRIAESMAYTAKLQAKVRQITVNTFLAPFLAAAGLMGATAALVKFFF